MADIDPMPQNLTAHAPAAAADAPATGNGASPWRRRLLLAIVPLALIAGGAWFWLSQQGKVSTDNAYIKQDKVAVSAQVGGKIVAVAVHEGDTVKAGDLLFRIDPEPYRISLDQADAAIASAQASQIALANSPDLTGAGIAAANEDIAFAQADFARKKALWDRGFLTRTEYDAAEHKLAQARESLRMAQADAAAARAKLATGPQVPGTFPAVAAARAQREAAQLNLQRTEVRAPSPGLVTQAERLLVGSDVVANLPVVTLVDQASTYVEANFKETDLGEIQVGQPVKITVDAFPGLELAGHVASIGGGTGSEFSVLPAQNATGNWVKVTQRVPVRIALDKPGERRLVAGLSAKVTIYTRGQKR